MVDQVKVVADDQAPAEQSLRRNLTNRHIQLIAIGGTSYMQNLFPLHSQ